MTTTTDGRKEELEPQTGADHFILETRTNLWNISTVMARHVESCLDRDPRPAWIMFVDLAGARIRIRSQDIESLAQSTAEQRQALRDLFRGWSRERKADKRWEDEGS